METSRTVNNPERLVHVMQTHYSEPDTSELDFGDECEILECNLYLDLDSLQFLEFTVITNCKCNGDKEMGKIIECDDEVETEECDVWTIEEARTQISDAIYQGFRFTHDEIFPGLVKAVVGDSRFDDMRAYASENRGDSRGEDHEFLDLDDFIAVIEQEHSVE